METSHVDNHIANSASLSCLTYREPLPLTSEEATVENQPVNIVRDNTFTRAVVDKVVILDLGRDVELACVQIGPVLTSLQDMEIHEKVDMTPSLTEVARLRMSWPSAVSMAMHVIEQGITSDKLRGDAILKSITDLVVKSEEAPNSKESGDE